MAEGVDYSWSRPGGAALAAAGKTFAVRYLYPGGGKGLTLGEAQDLQAHGVSIAVVFESSAARALDGSGAGAADAQIAQAQLAACGLAGDLPIYFGVDFAANGSQMGAIDAYLNGAASVLGQSRVGVYGSYAVTTHCRASGSAAWTWQTYAWSGGQQDTAAHLFQYNNGQNINGGVDLVRSLTNQFGQNGMSVAGLGDTPLIETHLTEIGTEMRVYQISDGGLQGTFWGLDVGAMFCAATAADGLLLATALNPGGTPIPLADGQIVTVAGYLGIPATLFGPGRGGVNWSYVKDIANKPATVSTTTTASVDFTPVLDAIKGIPVAPTTFVAK